MSSQYPHTTQAWLDAISSATESLRSRQQQGGFRSSNGDNDEMQCSRIDASLDYLERLESTLGTINRKLWDQVPLKHPTAFSGSGGDSFASATRLVPSQVYSGLPRTERSTNPFASIAYDEDTDEEDDENVEADDFDDEAGDCPTFHDDGDVMSVIRLVIRILTSSSDLWAAKGGILAHRHEWALGAAALQCAISKIQKALELADTQISRYYHHFSKTRGNTGKQQEKLHALQDDADIVHVAVQSLVRVRDKYISSANREKEYLERILRPQWESRDEVKARLGKDRWMNNPNPKYDYAKLREESEEKLRQIESALDALSEEALDGLSASAHFLKQRLLKSNRHRYNGKRPEELCPNDDVVIRLEGLPDATNFGWTFTGSNVQSRVEFFEKITNVDSNSSSATTTTPSLIKLDFYYTTGTVKTSLEHPTKGKTQMFCKDGITPELYIEILKNPRVHTDGQRYQTTTNSTRRTNNGNNHNDPRNGGGRGGRGRRGRGGRGIGRGGFGRGGTTIRRV